jgi:prepilin-type N-terminal cleavage/methylation domain-containing protein
MKNKFGFTLIELVVVIVVIGIITAAGFLTYTKIQQQSRDSQRTASATIIAEGLEKYFNANGEYPSVSQMTNPNATTPKQLLGLNNLDSFIAPHSPAGTTTNLWKAGTASSTDKLTYTGNTDVSVSCLTGVAATDVCADYKVQYYVDKTNTIETLYSRNKALAPPAAPAAPAATTITTALNGSNVDATTTAATCSAGSSTQYAFRSRTNDGAWSSFSTWNVVLTTSLPVAQGVKYGFQVKSQCINNGLTSADSATSVEATYIHPINTPSAPTVTESTSGNISTWNWNTTVCPAGTTARYQYKFVADWGYDSGWYGPYTGLTSRTWDTSSQGYQYTVQVQTHCYTAFDTSNWSGTGQDSYVRPVSGPGPITYSIRRGGPNIAYVAATSTCDSSAPLYSRADMHTWDYLWLDTQVYGWYADSHGGWLANAWNYYGSTNEVGATNGSYGPFSTGSRWNIAVEMKCRNSVTGRASAGTGRLESGILYLP